MRVAALLAFHEEDPAWLYDCVSSLGFCSHVVALGGPYREFPHSRVKVSLEERQAIRQAASDAGIKPWINIGQIWPTEMEKRSALFARGDTLGVDWFLVVDADEIVKDVPGDFLERLSEVEEDVIDVTLLEPRVQGEETPVITQFVHPWRMFFRAIPGIKVVRNHYTYVTPDKRVLWAAGWEAQVPGHTMQDVVFIHRTNLRDADRKAKANTYYEQRDELKVERAWKLNEYTLSELV